MRLIIIGLVISVFCPVPVLYAEFADGEGTAESPWLIETAEHLNNVRNYLGLDHQDKHFLQTADIDLGVAPYNEGEGWVPLGHTNPFNPWYVPFTGVYDGNNHKIMNLRIHRNAQEQGLFGYIICATIKNIRLKDAYVSGSNDVGLLIGKILRDSVVSNCYSTGRVYGNNNVGGLIGFIDRTTPVTGSGSSAAVVGLGDRVGGLIGRTDSRYLLSDSYADGYVRGSGRFVGGLVGAATSSISRSYTNAHVTGYRQVGGLAGSVSGGVVRDSYSVSYVSAEEGISGGLVGYINDGRIINCYATGYVEHSQNTGGLTGSGYRSSSSNSYWNYISSNQQDSFFGTPYTANQMVQQANFEDWNFNTVWQIVEENSYPYLSWQEAPLSHNFPAPLQLENYVWDNTVLLTWQAPSVGQIIGYRIYRSGTLVNEDTLVEALQYLDISAEYSREYVYHITAVLSNNQETGFSNPGFVQTELNFGAGSGSYDDPYIISDHHQFNAIRLDLGASYRLGNNINLSDYADGQGWEPIGDRTNPFNGSLDGGGYEISNLTINRFLENELGLFGRTNGAIFDNLRLTDINIVGNRNVGGLTGLSYYTVVKNSAVKGEINSNGYSGFYASYFISGLIENSYSAGLISADSPGGISSNTQNSTLRNCYSTAIINATGNGIAGGISAVFDTSVLESSYSTGKLIFPGTYSSAGGLIGLVSGNISITDCFWNTESTGLYFSAGGGKGLTTIEMTGIEAFSDWDFDNVWMLGFEDEITYPWLVMQAEPVNDNYPAIIPPGRLKAFVPDDTALILNWSLPSFGSPDLFRIYRDGELLASIGGNAQQYRDDDVVSLTNYSYCVTAIYGEQESHRSNIVNAAPVPGGYAAGRGTVEEPYQIESAGQLAYVRYNHESHYIQIDDIDLSGIETWMPIGGMTYDYGITNHPFIGSYDGRGHRISNLTMNRTVSQYNGLFGYVGRADVEVTLKNIFLENVDITAYVNVGGLAGVVTNNTKIDNCHVSGHILNTAGYDSSTLRTGGLVGELNSSHISNSSTRVTVAGRHCVGGLLGVSTNRSVVRKSYATGTVTGERFGYYIGGFVGRNQDRTIIQDCYAAVDVFGGEYSIGGFAGGNILAAMSSPTPRTSIISCYSIGRVLPSEQATRFGGFDGFTFNALVTESYWNTDRSGISYSDLAEGRTSEQMRYPFDGNTYRDWDFDKVWQFDPEGDINGGYPYHRWIKDDIVKDYPYIALAPNPGNGDNNVSISTRDVSWSFFVDVMYANPAGFRFYFSETYNFDEEDYVWVPYVCNQALYTQLDVIPEDADFTDKFYWKVVPATVRERYHSPERRRQNINPSNRQSILSRNDAVNVPVWSFSIERHPNPVVAENPIPQNQSTDIPLDLPYLRWSYESDPYHSDPRYFKVYINTGGDFTDDDIIDWVWYSSYSTNFSCRIRFTDILDPYTTYYWKIVPTTNSPYYGLNTSANSYPTEDGERGRCHSPERRRQNGKSANRYNVFFRGDAEDVPVWSFTTGETLNAGETVVYPLVTELGVNYPNPFNPETIISFSIADPGKVLIEIYNSRGQRVKTIANEYLDAGNHQIKWSGRDSQGSPVGSGVYFYRMLTGNYQETKKMLLLK